MISYYHRQPLVPYPNGHWLLKAELLDTDFVGCRVVEAFGAPIDRQLFRPLLPYIAGVDDHDRLHVTLPTLSPSHSDRGPGLYIPSKRNFTCQGGSIK